MKGRQLDELESFKTNISLTDYAESLGYEFQPKTSSKRCHVLKNGDDKIIITRMADGHDVYFNVKNPTDSGSIIDFIQHRQNKNLGEIRKELRSWVGLSVTPISKKISRTALRDRPEIVTKDISNLLASFHALRKYQSNYLSDVRHLSPETIAAFSSVVRSDAKGNTVFIHRNITNNVTGWDLKNRGFTGFVPGGEKSLVQCNPSREPTHRVIIFESMIDAMSYYQIKGKKGDLYVSFSGGMSPDQKEQLKSVVLNAPAVVIATDNDKQGDEYANMLKEWNSSATRELPEIGKDWNDVLIARCEQLVNISPSRRMSR